MHPKLFEKVHWKYSYHWCNLYKLSQMKWWEQNQRTITLLLDLNVIS